MRLVHVALLILLVGALVGCDHATKHLAASHLREAPATVIPGVVELGYTENRDSAFGLLHPILSAEQRLPLLVGLKIAGILIALWFLGRRWPKSSAIEKLGLAMIVAGALGNLIDRVGRGYVVDFIHVSYWPLFNVADIAVCVGVGLLFLAGNAAEPPAPRRRRSSSERHSRGSA